MDNSEIKSTLDRIESNVSDIHNKLDGVLQTCPVQKSKVEQLEKIVYGAVKLVLISVGSAFMYLIFGSK